MSTDIATLGISVDSRSVKGASLDLDKLAMSGTRAEREITALEAANSHLRNTLNSVLGPMRMMRDMLLAIGVGLGIRQIIEAADSWKLLEGRLKLVTSSAAELAAVQTSLFASAQRTRSGFEATVELYARLARSSKTLGTSQADLINITETINRTMLISGTSAESANAAMIQLGQGLASGALRGDELNSVMENAPRLAEAIAVGMGKTMGQLRSLGAQGKITGQQIVDALLSQQEAIKQEASQIPLTVGRSLGVLKDVVFQFVGQGDAALGASQALAKGIIWLSDNFRIVEATMAATATGMGTMALTLLPRLAAGFMAAAEATAAFTAALATNPIGLLAVGLSAAVGALVYFRDTQVEIAGQTATVWNVAMATFEVVGQRISAAVDVVRTKFDAMFGPGALDQVGAFASAFLVNMVKLPTTLLNTTYAVAKTVTDAFLIAFDEIAAALKRLMDYMGGAFHGLGEAMRLSLAGEFEAAGKALANGLNTEVGGVGSDLVGRVAAAAKANFGTDWWTAFLTSVAGGVSGASEQLIADIAKRAAERTKAATPAGFDLTKPGIRTAPPLSPEAEKEMQNLRLQAEAQERLAIAVGQGSDAMMRMEVHNRAVAKAFEAGSGSVAMWEAALLRLREAERSIDRAEHIRDTQQQVAANDNLTKAYLDGTAAAIKSAERENDIVAQVNKLGFAYGDAAAQVNALASSRDRADNAKEVARIREETDAVYALARERERLAQLQGLTPDQAQQRTNAVIDRFVGGGERMGEIKAREDAARQMENVKALIDAGVLGADRMKAAYDDAYDAMLRASNNWLDGATIGLRDYMREAGNTAKQTYRLMSDAMRSMEDSIVQAVKTGKLSFNDLFNTILEGMIRIAAQKAILGPMEGIFGSILGGLTSGIAGMFGGGGVAGVQTDLIPSIAGGIGVAHVGGIAGFGTGINRNIDPMIFMGAERFHTGGIPGLGPGEVPIIAKWDEEIITRKDSRHRWNGGAANSNPPSGAIGSVTIIDQRSGSDARAGDGVAVNRRRGSDGLDAVEIIIGETYEKLRKAGRFDDVEKQVAGIRRQAVRRS